MRHISRKIQRQHRHRRIRAKIFGTVERPRLAVFRSAKHIAAQIINDQSGKTLVAATDKHLPKNSKLLKAYSAKSAVAFAVGQLLAERAVAKKISKVVFDNGGFQYLGRVKALAEGARSGGLKF
ncbi:50S ribosomal protein L18 [Candidatus Parcubacteria bacterium]|jgi:large subunit ribosomal protein L18|nr:MAG: 50S ribosomal protein L18 [Candidatus Parcubacteria bacterium]